MLTLPPHTGRARRDVWPVLIWAGLCGPILLSACARHAPAAAGPTAQGSFQLSDDQLRSMTTEEVAVHDFHSETMSDGRIAYNGDTMTPVYSPYSGRVTRVLAALGARVKRGQPLFEVDASEYAQAGSDLLTAAAQHKLSSASEQRRHAQYDAHSGSLQDWQQAQSDLASANASLDAVRNRLRILGQSEQQIDAVLASGRPLSAAAAIAPIAGTVVDRQIGVGQFVQAGASTPVYTIADLSTVWLVANVREADVAGVHVGQSVSAHVLADPAHILTGRIDYVGAGVDPLTRRVPVHAVLANADGRLKPQMFADFTIATSEDRAAPAIPQEAVVFEGPQARAWVLQGGRSVALRVLTLGRLYDGRYEVLDGLTAGERVITHGALFIDRAAGG
ncbi:MAG TPA: efflux RND transporter periplasmic adaptor subunit [Steroidobacteraceae bacterium]|jgi:cobalt-zinc-cadmium efflux system membrane fusion protein|nr:efflux RND transporter periplasmic adaptor subunit [Steroidobacteraceae bacterium]